jgi:uncharacterized protein YeaO (DUF488 family)
LSGKKTLLQRLNQASEERAVTLLFGARDQEHNQAVALKKVLDGRR